MRSPDGCIFWFLRVVAPFVRRLLPVKGYRTILLPGRSCSHDGNGAIHPSIPEVQLAAHPATCAKLLILYPGLNATLDGESRQFTQVHPYRYRRLAERLQSEGVAAVVRVANPASGYHGGGQVAADRLS